MSKKHDNQENYDSRLPEGEIDELRSSTSKARSENTQIKVEYQNILEHGVQVVEEGKGENEHGISWQEFQEANEEGDKYKSLEQELDLESKVTVEDQNAEQDPNLQTVGISWKK